MKGEGREDRIEGLWLEWQRRVSWWEYSACVRGKERVEGEIGIAVEEGRRGVGRGEV